MAKIRFVPEDNINSYSDRWREYADYSNPITKRIFPTIIREYFRQMSLILIEKGRVRFLYLGKVIMKIYKLKEPKIVNNKIVTEAIKCMYIDDNSRKNTIKFRRRLIASAYQDWARVRMVYKHY